jgi:lipopolysaccharide transport system permease protein
MHWDRYRDIVFYRAYAELKAEAQLNYMGYVWWVLEPLLNTVLFYVILVAVLEQSTAGAISFVLVGSVVWQWMNSSILGASGSIFEAGTMLKHVYLPKIVLPLIVLVVTTWKFLFLFALLLVWIWATGHPPTPAYLALPLLLLLQLALISAISLPLAAAIPYVPDARIAVDAALRTLMLISGIFFPITRLPAAYHFYFNLNPVAVVIEAYRAILLDGRWPNGALLAYVAAFSAASLLVTFAIYRRVDRSIVKVINR